MACNCVKKNGCRCNCVETTDADDVDPDLEIELPLIHENDVKNVKIYSEKQALDTADLVATIKMIYPMPLLMPMIQNATKASKSVGIKEKEGVTVARAL